MGTIPLLIPDESPAFDADGFDALIRDNGVPFRHFRALPCPVGETDEGDMRRPHEDHSGCTNGYIYTFSGIVTVGFASNSKNSRFDDVGRLDQSTVQVLLSRFYDEEDGTAGACGEDSRVYIAPFDRMYLIKDSVKVPTWEKFNASGREVDRARFPIVDVVDLMDSQGVRRIEGQDFVIEGGNLRWLPGHAPVPDPRTGKGPVVAIRYLYRPYYYVRNLPHEIRVAHVDVGSEDGDGVERLPQVATLVREYAFEVADRDEQLKDARAIPRQANQPSDRQAPLIADLRSFAQPL